MNGVKSALIDPNLDGNLSDVPIIRPLVSDTRNTKWYKRIVNWFTRKVNYQVMEDYYYNLPWNDIVLFIPKGFIFDGASIPKFLWPVLAPIDVLIIPAVFHDFGYRYQTLLTRGGFLYMTDKDRIEYDQLFRDLSLCTNGLKLPSYAAYTALRIFGIFPWRENRAYRKRVKIDFPTIVVETTKGAIEDYGKRC